jgi:effector-binding domain-containing protein
MIDTPHIAQVAAHSAAVIRLTVPRTEIRNVMGPAMAELKALLAAQGIPPVGPIFSHHFRMDPGVFDFEVGIPVAANVAPAGRVQPGVLPAATVARAIHRGDYQGLGDAWEELDAWITAQGHLTAPGMWESYVAGPESSATPADWRTELNRPIALR